MLTGQINIVLSQNVHKIKQHIINWSDVGLGDRVKCEATVFWNCLLTQSTVFYKTVTEGAFYRTLSISLSMSAEKTEILIEYLKSCIKTGDVIFMTSYSERINAFQTKYTEGGRGKGCGGEWLTEWLSEWLTHQPPYHWT